MKYCYRCGIALDDDAQYCKECGTMQNFQEMRECEPEETLLEPEITISPELHEKYLEEAMRRIEESRREAEESKRREKEEMSKRGITDRNALCVLLLIGAVILWLFAPLYDPFIFLQDSEPSGAKLLAFGLERLSSQSGAAQLMCYGGGLALCILFAIIAVIKNRGNYSRAFSIIGSLLMFMPIFEVLYNSSESSSVNFPDYFWDRFGWGCWAILIVLFIVICTSEDTRYISSRQSAEEIDEIEDVEDSESGHTEQPVIETMEQSWVCVECGTNNSWKYSQCKKCGNYRR